MTTRIFITQTVFITQTEFDNILFEILQEAGAGELLLIPGLYEIVSEYYNNEVLSIWEERQ